MNQLIQGIQRFGNDEEGVTMVEYGLIAALIAVVSIAAITGLGGNLKVVFTDICTKLATAVGAGAVACS